MNQPEKLGNVWIATTIDGGFGRCNVTSPSIWLSLERMTISPGWWFQPLWKNISQLGWLFPIYEKIKNVPNHQPDPSSWTCSLHNFRTKHATKKKSTWIHLASWMIHRTQRRWFSITKPPQVVFWDFWVGVNELSHKYVL